MPGAGRGVLAAGPRGPGGDALLAGLAAAGQPCLPYPDRDRRQPGLAETEPGLTLKCLLWETSALAAAPGTPAGREVLFRASSAPPHRAGTTRSTMAWAELASNLDLLLRALGSPEGYDLDPVREALTLARSERELSRAASLFDAVLIAGTARRYLLSPESCLFLGDRDGGYVILPADGLVRRLALGGTGGRAARLFPEASLRDRLGSQAQWRQVDLLGVPGRPQRVEAVFHEPPRYEFDNLDEMMWWKHCRHLAGSTLPTEGLRDLVVLLGAGSANDEPLLLSRSRHRTLSFRFEPAAAWRARVPTRDGRTYGFRVLRAVYETASTADETAI
jgi:hypothetical protein